MPEPSTSPAPAVSPDSGAGAGPDSPAKGRDRYAQMLSIAESAKKSRDQFATLLNEEKAKNAANDQAINELRAVVAELKAANAVNQAKPRSPWADFSSASDDQLVAAMTARGVDPLTGQPTSPDPATAGRAQYELMERRARALAEQIAEEKVAKLRTGLDSRDRAREEMAKAERRLQAVYGSAIGDPESPLRKMAAQAFQPFVQEYGEEYAKSPAGLQHLFAESQRILLADEAQRERAEADKLRAAQRATINRQWGSGGPPALPTDKMKDALKSKSGRTGVRDAIREMKTLPGKPLVVTAVPQE